MSQIEYIATIEDVRLAAYRELKDKQLAARYGLFIVEGEFLVRRLLDSALQIHSLLMTHSRFNSNDWNVPEAPVYLADEKVISQLVGFTFHRGVLALGWRPELPSPQNLFSEGTMPARLIVLPEINDVENLGCLMRTGAALGFRHFILGHSCCDPFARRAVRTSMGAVFQLRLARSNDLRADLCLLCETYNFKLHAALLSEKAKPLEQVKSPARVALLFGSEALGLAPKWTALCDEQVTIPMSSNVDSLNVCVAAGIMMAHYHERG